jgi:hypothetical protein
MPGSNDSSITVGVKTVADTSGVDKTVGAVGRLSAASKASEATTGKMAQAVTIGNAAYEAMSSGIERVTGFMGSSIESANRYQASIIGLSSVSRAYGADSNAATEAAKRLASDGLMTVADAATGLKNLLGAGFSLPQATQMMNAFKDSAAFGRQSALGFGESIRGATEGIKNGNSILVDNAGVTKNLSVILEEAGKSQQDVMNITSDSSVRQAVYNGILRETAAQTGDASRLTSTYAGEQARAAAATESMKQTVGALEQAIGGGLLNAFTSVIGNNQQLIVSLGAATGGAAVFSGGLFLAIKAIQSFTFSSIVAAATNPLVMLLTAVGILAGVVVYKAVDKMQSKIAQSNTNMSNMGDTLGNTIPAGSKKADKAMADLQKRLSDIDGQIMKSNRDFKESLAEMIKGYQEKASDLKKQIDEENANFADSSSRQSDDFKRTTETMTSDHQKKVDKIQQQLNNELALGKWADQQKIRDLQAQLAEENAENAAQLAEKQANYDQDVAQAKASHDKKITDLQAQLDTENGILQKHAADVASIRDVMLLDEVDKLKRGNQEQHDAFQKQKQDAIDNASQTAAGVGGVWDNANAGLNNKFADMGKSMGNSMGNAFKDALKGAIVDTGKGLVNFLGKATTFLAKGFDPRRDSAGGLSKLWQDASNDPAFGWRVSGGPVNAGSPYFVGENPDGTINDTTELFVPRQSGTVVSAKDTQRLLGGTSGGGGSNVIINQTNHIYNQVDMAEANRTLGWKLALKGI